MTEAVTISFRITGPMMFRGPGEFDPSVRGTYSRAMTLAMPSPSTVAGALATYCISELNAAAAESADWLERYLSVLGSDVEVRGPLIELDRELMAEDKLSGGFLTMEEVRRKCGEVWRRLSWRPSSLEQLDEYLKEEKKFEPSVEVRRDVRVGVRLLMRKEAPIKSAKEGFLYSAEYINYTEVKADEAEEGYTSLHFREAEVVAEVRGGLAKNLGSARALPVKFGGEGRVAILSFRLGERILDEVRKRLWGGEVRHDGLLALYLATPALFKGGKGVEEQVRQWAEGMNCEFVGLSGESAALGAGFMVKEGRRKPIYTSLSPGSIILLKGGFNLLEIYRKALGEASMLGYGTLIHVPMG